MDGGSTKHRTLTSKIPGRVRILKQLVSNGVLQVLPIFNQDDDCPLVLICAMSDQSRTALMTKGQQGQKYHEQKGKSFFAVEIQLAIAKCPHT